MALLCPLQALKRCGVDFIVAPYEADAQMAYLALNGLVAAVLTEDSDLLAYGCPRVSLPGLSPGCQALSQGTTAVSQSSAELACSLSHSADPEGRSDSRSQMRAARAAIIDEAGTKATIDSLPSSCPCASFLSTSNSSAQGLGLSSCWQAAAAAMLASLPSRQHCSEQGACAALTPTPLL